MSLSIADSVQRVRDEDAAAAVATHAKRVARALKVLAAVESIDSADRFDIGRDERDHTILATADVGDRELGVGMGSLEGALLELGAQVRQ